MKAQLAFFWSSPLCRAAFVPSAIASSRAVVDTTMVPKTTSTVLRSETDDATSNDAAAQLWQVFPAHHWERLQERHGKDRVKLVHIVRHAEGTHNVNMEYKSEIHVDARLTDKGHAQCQALAARIRTDESLQTLRQASETCVVTSPLTRCVQTALHSFPHLIPHVPVLAHEAWRETVNYNCDRRRHLEKIQKEFPHVDFGGCVDGHDAIWHEYRQRLGDDWDTHMESAELYRVAKRGWEGFRALEGRPESQVVVCTHSAFLRCILNWGQQGGVPKLMPQQLDDREDKTSTKLFGYADDLVPLENGEEVSFEEYMRRDFRNCELRSFCLLTQSTSR